MKTSLSLSLRIMMLCVSMVFLSCGTARRSVPLRSSLDNKGEEVVMGRKVFMAYCQPCHPHGEAGLGLAINNKPLPGFMIRFQVRNGVGVMPKFEEPVISDQDLRHLVTYLKALRKNEK